MSIGEDAFSTLDPDRGVLLVANHRSFFDFYAISVAMFGGPVPWLRRLHFPVRGEFYHSSIAGIALNLAAGLGVMYPPFFRERSKFAIKRDGLGYLAARLAERGSIVGLHPEGGRSRDADPYRLQQLHPEAGELAVKAKPLVVPVFINGLTNSVGAEWQMSRDPDARSRTPLIVVFGEAIRPDGLPAQEPSARAYKLVTDLLGERILALGRREQAIRAGCAAGNVPDDDRRWLTNRDGGRFYARR